MTDYCPVVKWRDMNQTIFARRCDMIAMRLGGNNVADKEGALMKKGLTDNAWRRVGGDGWN